MSIDGIAYRPDASSSELWRKMDADGDGCVTAQEYRQAPLPRYVADQVIASFLTQADLSEAGTKKFLEEIGDRAPGLYRSLRIFSLPTAKIPQAAESSALPPSGLEVIPDNEGRITHLLVTLDERKRYAPFYSSFLDLVKKRPEVDFTVMVSEAQKEDFRRMMERDLTQEQRKNIHLMETHFISGEVPHAWPQDPIQIARDSKGGTHVLLPASRPESRFRDIGFFDLGRALAENRGWETVSTPFMIDGGNVIVTSGRIFVGQNDVRKDWTGLLQSLSLKLFYGRKEIVPVGSSKASTPEAHLDMYLRPLPINDPSSGKPIALVGDIRHGREILEELPARRKREILTAAGKEFDEALPHQFIPDGVSPADRTKRLDETAMELQRQGYSVVRIPYPMLSLAGGRANLSYTNGLFESYRDAAGRKVLRATIPAYGIPELDRPARAVYERLGYEVIQIRGLLPRSVQQGSLRCSVKVIGVSDEI